MRRARRPCAPPPARKQRLLAGRSKTCGSLLAKHFIQGAGPARRRATRRSRVGTPQRRAARACHGWRGAIPCARGGGQGPGRPAPHGSATGSLLPDNGDLPGRLGPHLRFRRMDGGAVSLGNRPPVAGRADSARLGPAAPAQAPPPGECAPQAAGRRPPPCCPATPVPEATFISFETILGQSLLGKTVAHPQDVAEVVEHPVVNQV